MKNPHQDHEHQIEAGIRLNKYVASCGVASRRKAAELIKQGLVKVNGAIQTNPAVLVSGQDQVHFKNKQIQPERSLVYCLMNKPKGIITTVQDEKGRKTVMDILGQKIKERIYPVGRLDRDSMGLLLLTNDGDLAQKLAHPKHRIKKIYHVQVDRTITARDLDKIRSGVVLEDGKALIDGIEYVKGQAKNEVGIELHMGKNRIIRRVFEHLGYQVIKLDRVYYAGLTKKDLPRGRFRRLSEKEIIMLKHFT